MVTGFNEQKTKNGDIIACLRRPGRFAPLADFMEEDLEATDAKKTSASRTKSFNTLLNQLQAQEKRVEKSPNKVGLAEESTMMAELRTKLTAAQKFNTHLYKAQTEPTELQAAYEDFLNACPDSSIGVPVQTKVWNTMCEHAMLYRDYSGFAALCDITSDKDICLVFVRWEGRSKILDKQQRNLKR